MRQFIVVATGQGHLHRIPIQAFDDLPDGGHMQIPLAKEEENLEPDFLVGVTTVYCEEAEPKNEKSRILRRK